MRKKIELLYAIIFVHFILSDSKFNARHASFYRIKNFKIIGGVQHMIIQQKIDLWLIITQMVHYQPVSKIISCLVIYFPNKNRENMKWPSFV